MARTKARGFRKGGRGLGQLGAPTTAKPAKVAVESDYANQFDSLDKDILGKDESDDEEYDYDKEKDKEAMRNRDEEEEEKDCAYMLFDFRKGPENWPQNVEYVDPRRADELLERATASAAEEAAKSQQKKEGEEKSAGETSKAGSSSYYSASKTKENVEEDVKQYPSPPPSTFEKLKDGSFALMIKPGHRLKIKLNDLLEGGDENREEREKEEEREKKLYAKYGLKYGKYKSSGMGNDDDFGTDSKKWLKNYINEYTITVDMKMTEPAPREGIALYQTALIHSDENKRTGKTTLSKSDGECIINAGGGVGIFGTFGDVTKAKIDINSWKRVVVSVKCVESKTEKGEMRTWIGTESGIVVKEDAFSSDDRFAIDPDALYLFSSGQSAMMPGKISIRSIRVDAKFSTDLDVRANHARDKVSMIVLTP
jgi:hypothetical protein